MAEKITDTQYEKANVNPFNAPTPGESLTNSPDMPQAWERPPKHTEQDEAMEAIYLELTSDEVTQRLEIVNGAAQIEEFVQMGVAFDFQDEFVRIEKRRITNI